MGLMISPSYQFLNNFNSGLELGLDLYLDLLPAFKEKVYKNDFFTGIDNADEVLRLLEKPQFMKIYFRASRILSYGFKIGYYYEIR